MSYPHIARAGAIVATALVLSLPRAARAQGHEHQGEAPMHSEQIRIPESIRVEHEEIHDALDRATRAPGRVGDAARELAAILHPHFVREEQIALPPLGLLAPLASGEATPEEMRRVLPMADSLRAELPRMLEEHRAIRAATLRLGEVAREERNVQVVQLTEQLARHAQSEEELFYPAAILVGDVVRAKMPAGRAP